MRFEIPSDEGEDIELYQQVKQTILFGLYWAVTGIIFIISPILLGYLIFRDRDLRSKAWWYLLHAPGVTMLSSYEIWMNSTDMPAESKKVVVNSATVFYYVVAAMSIIAIVTR